MYLLLLTFDALLDNVMDMPTVKERKPKWDYNLAFMLYCGGMPFSQILGRREFDGLTYNTLTNYASIHNWRGRRDDMETSAVGAMAKELVTRVNEAKTIHQNFVLDQIEEERDIILSTPKIANPKAQRERLDNLKTLDDIARKTLGIDNDAPLTGAQKVFGILIQMQDKAPPQPKQLNGSGRVLDTSDRVLALVTREDEDDASLGSQCKAECMPSAINPLPSQKNHSEGILGPLNAYLGTGVNPESESSEESRDKSANKSQSEYKKTLPEFKL